MMRLPSNLGRPSLQTEGSGKCVQQSVWCVATLALILPCTALQCVPTAAPNHHSDKKKLLLGFSQHLETVYIQQWIWLEFLRNIYPKPFCLLSVARRGEIFPYSFEQVKKKIPPWGKQVRSLVQVLTRYFSLLPVPLVCRVLSRRSLIN